MLLNLNETYPIDYYLQEDAFYYTTNSNPNPRGYEMTIAEIIINDVQVDIWP